MFIMITMIVMRMMTIILVPFDDHLTKANIPPMLDTMGQLHGLLHLFVKDIITIAVSVVFVVFVIFVVNIIIVLIIVKRILMLQ